MNNDTVSTGPNRGFAGNFAARFVDSKLTPLAVIAAILLGLASTILLPREEEPQIQVPMVDVFVTMPGAGAQEVAERVTRPMEKLLWEIPGVEYVYSTSSPGQSMVIVRFDVGEDLERSLVKLNQKLQGNFELIPPGASHPLVKPRSIDDVPVLALTFHSASHDHLALRRLVSQVDEYVKQVPQVAETTLIGGARREVRVLVDPARLAARSLILTDLPPLLRQANRQLVSGALTNENREFVVETGSFFRNAQEVGRTVIGMHDGRPIFLDDVAEVVDGAEEIRDYVFFGQGGPERAHEPNQEAVTLSVAKRPGANAIHVVDQVLEKIDLLKGQVIPGDVAVTVTRDYGETAAEKSNELLLHMGIAVFGVAVLILLFLGWRESLIVLLAIPATLGLTLLVFYLYGYTLNRITLFALIFSIGILVDDAIVVVENIVRHVRMDKNRGRALVPVIIEAVDEVGNPTVLATWAVVAAILPMAFVGGLMGPYMRPIPVGATAAMLFSLIIAFVVTPWASNRLLFLGRKREDTGHEEGKEGPLTRGYRSVMAPLLRHRGWRWGFLAAITILLLGSMSLVGIGWVKVKMLPFDNKSEFQVILNMPEGSTLEQTAQAAQEIAEVIRQEPEIEDYQVYVGTAAPFNFSGLVRHYYLREGSHVADIQVNLVGKGRRSDQSHDIVLRLRPAVTEVAGRYGAAVTLAEVPPGPPVLQTLVAEIYGPTQEDRLALAGDVRRIMENTPGVVDIDWYVEADQPKLVYQVDRQKALFHGVSPQAVEQTMRIAASGTAVDLLHLPHEREDLPIRVELPRGSRSHAEDLLALRVRGGEGPDAPLISLRELGAFEETLADKSIYRKNLMPVVYVTADVGGVIDSPAYAILEMNRELAKLNRSDYGGTGGPVELTHVRLPFHDLEPAIKWDGEWHITIEVFRDLGAAFAAVLILIYMLMVGWFRSFVTPLIVMVAIPFSLVGILPAHGAMDAFFSATSMIGFMAGAGIVVRNSIILVDFIELRLREGQALADAVVDAGAVRFRPMLLTALAVVVAASVILPDPIFQGLAIALMAGEIASLLISRMAVPVIYFMVNDKTPKRTAG
ncbi:MAG: efflux RND transporter permease subunit [Opitutales bacterium]